MSVFIREGGGTGATTTLDTANFNGILSGADTDAQLALDTLDDSDLAGLNTQTGASYTLAISDRNKLVEMNNASANTVSIPLNSSVAFPVGTQITIVQLGTGQTTVDAVAGVTLNGVDSASRATISQYESITIYKRATDAWVALNV